MKKIVVIGNGMVGYKFCEKLLEKGGLQNFELTVFGAEPRPAYDRVHLSEYFSTQDAAHLAMCPANWYADNNIELITGDAVVDVHTADKTVRSHNGVVRSYDVLVLATGSNCFMPAIEGSEKRGVFLYRTIEDLDAMISYAQNCRRAAVLGGGLLGLEAAKALVDLNLEAHVVEFAPKLMARQLDDAGSRVLKNKIEAMGIGVHLSKSTQEIVGDGYVTGLRFADGSTLEVEMLVVSAGIAPNDGLARLMGLQMGHRGGVVVDEHMQTSHSDVYAIGECALFDGMIYGLVAPGYDMAEVVAHNLVRGEATPPKLFKGADMSTKLKLLGVEVGSFGEAMTDDAHAIVYEDSLKGTYKRINICKDKKKLLGGVLVGDTSDYGILQQMTLNSMKLPANPEGLIIKTEGGGGVSMDVADLPDAAIICSCEAVSKGVICGAVTGGCDNLGSLKASTKAGTGCGGCLPMVKDLMNVTFKSMGREVKNVLCEHFAYTRQELLHLIKLKQHKRYNDVLDVHGVGDGCEICKPAVASLLASLWNEPILANKNDVAQDTNDRFLANIQKGGTYSVVPRIPGGEITPDKLLVIASVAKKYNLYTKITGGQRIDLFGAQLNDLPAIWEELINAGMESGHAYGKSLRTVKSCVGSTWCRFGVQDSVGFAIEVENRYKGLRSPHKLKSAVSGCTRECAEAQSKDFGIIATEKGWNLYVCGNGGIKPQHALLLASDIDSATCIKYIDRFLMFYIQTAEPLHRTSTWLNKLDGGIEYLKDVVINDSLGICDDLEAQMTHHVATYHCEWKDAVEDEEKRRRFKHFVNSDERDSTIKFIEVRGQIAPAGW
jgi:nitrite reductase (NADH) large subunit